MSEYCALCGNFIEEDPMRHWEKCKNEELEHPKSEVLSDRGEGSPGMGPST